MWPKLLRDDTAWNCAADPTRWLDPTALDAVEANAPGDAAPELVGLFASSPGESLARLIDQLRPVERQAPERHSAAEQDDIGAGELYPIHE